MADSNRRPPVCELSAVGSFWLVLRLRGFGLGAVALDAPPILAVPPGILDMPCI